MNIEMVNNEIVAEKRDWRDGVTTGFRKNFIQKMMKIINDTNSFELNPKKIENVVYETANSDYEYFDLLTDKMFQFQAMQGQASTSSSVVLENASCSVPNKTRT